ncbi:MAG: hypothetical protein JWR35_2514 [Marmoricola sp.]|nr:hypothetical protein [Marmoricola sp.]
MWVYLVWRFGHLHARRNVAIRVLYGVLDLVVVRSWAGARVPAQVTIGERVAFLHDAQGLVIHPRVVIGDDVRIYHQVTIGSATNKPGIPVIGNGVLIGVGAKILGPVNIGDGARIGANAVVTRDVPAGATAVGIPARVLDPREPQVC